MALDTAAARDELLRTLDECTLLPLFIARVPVRVNAALSLLSDGTITADEFFPDPSTRRVSFLDQLLEEHQNSRPNLSPFVEGQFVRANQGPEVQLREDMDVFQAVLTACRDPGADSDIQQAANQPELTAKRWRTYVARMSALSTGHDWSTAYNEGLGEIARLPPSAGRAASAQVFACAISLLHDPVSQRDAFFHAVSLAVTPPNADVYRTLALSLATCENSIIPCGANDLLDQAHCVANTNHAAHALIGDLVQSIAEALHLPSFHVGRWWDEGNLVIELQQLVHTGGMERAKTRKRNGDTVLPICTRPCCPGV